MYKASISNEEIQTLDLLQFEGQIYIISEDKQINAAIEKLKRHRILGFDTETKPNYVKKRKNKVALLQIATNDEVYIFRLQYLTNYTPLFELLSDPNIIKVGVAVDGDLKELLNLKKFRPANFIELQSYIKNFNIENFSLKKMAAIVLNVKISKRQQRSDWEAIDLSEAQLIYAATDAWASLLIYQKLKSSQSEL